MNIGNAWEVGRDGKGIEFCEYCESLSLPACDIDMGRGAVVLLCCGDVVMIGGRGGWLGFEVGEETAGGDVAGEDVADMTDVIFGGDSRVVPEHEARSTQYEQIFRRGRCRRGSRAQPQQC